MLFDTKTVPSRNELLLDLAAFGGTVVAAVVQGWNAVDIVWASWITSLVIGLSFFLILSLKKLRDYTLAAPPVEHDRGVETSGESTEADDGAEAESEGEAAEAAAEADSEAPKPMEGNAGCLFLAVGGLLTLLAWFAGPGPARITLLVLVALDFVALVISILAPRGWFGLSLRRPVVRAFFFLPTSLFMFFFFLMHFGGFHLGHAFVLGFFVPPEVGFEVTAGAVAAPTVEPASMREALVDLRDALVGVREACVVFLGLLILTYWPYIVSVAVKSFGAYREALLGESKQGDEMLLPYKNVIRVHLLIFVLIPLATIGSGMVMTLAVLVFFFFPVEAVVAWVKSR
ncbi:DUF6498-containing protein [Gemmatimonadota bacterium]